MTTRQVDAAIARYLDKGTKGPWRECRNGDCTCGIIWSIPGDFPVCTSAGGSTFPVAVSHQHMADAPDMIYASMSPEQCAANAALVAIAPDLATEVTRLREVNARLMSKFSVCLDVWGQPGPLYDEATAALKDAGG